MLAGQARRGDSVCCVPYPLCCAANWSCLAFPAALQVLLFPAMKPELTDKPAAAAAAAATDGMAGLSVVSTHIAGRPLCCLFMTCRGGGCSCRRVFARVRRCRCSLSGPLLRPPPTDPAIAPASSLSATCSPASRARPRAERALRLTCLAAGGGWRRAGDTAGSARQPQAQLQGRRQAPRAARLRSVLRCHVCWHRLAAPPAARLLRRRAG